MKRKVVASILYIIFCNIIWFIFLGFGLRNFYLFSKLHNHGVPTIATVYDKYKELLNRHVICYSYYLPSKHKNILTDSAVEIPFWNNTKIGQTIPIKYLEDESKIARIDIGTVDSGKGYALFYVLILTALLFPIIYLNSNVYKFYKAKKTLHHIRSTIKSQ